MTETPKVLGQLVPAATTLSILYTTPGATNVVGSTIVVTNQSTDTTFRISIAVAGAADNAKQYLAWNAAIPANSFVAITVGFMLGAADVIRVYSDSGNVSFNAFGVERA